VIKDIFILGLEYLEVSTNREKLFDWMFPLVLCTVSGIVTFALRLCPAPENVMSSTIQFLSILVGFSIASLAILVSAPNENIRKSHDDKTKRTIRGKEASIYQLLLSSIATAVLIELTVMLMILSFGAILADATPFFSQFVFIYLAAIPVFMTLRAVVSLYFVNHEKYLS
jgi:hypothetical protein